MLLLSSSHFDPSYPSVAYIPPPLPLPPCSLILLAPSFSLLDRFCSAKPAFPPCEITNKVRQVSPRFKRRTNLPTPFSNSLDKEKGPKIKPNAVLAFNATSTLYWKCASDVDIPDISKKKQTAPVVLVYPSCSSVRGASSMCHPMLSCLYPVHANKYSKFEGKRERSAEAID